MKVWSVLKKNHSHNLHAQVIGDTLVIKMSFMISYRVVAWVIISLKEGWGRITEAISSSVSF